MTLEFSFKETTFFLSSEKFNLEKLIKAQQYVLENSSSDEVKAMCQDRLKLLTDTMQNLKMDEINLIEKNRLEITKLIEETNVSDEFISKKTRSSRKRKAEFMDTFWKQNNNWSELICAAEFVLKENYVSERVTTRCVNQLDRLSELSDTIGDTERTLVEKYRNIINCCLNEGDFFKQKTYSRLVYKKELDEIIDLFWERKRVEKPYPTIRQTDCFPLLTIPAHLQNLVMEKFEYKQFAIFHECNKHTHHMCTTTDKLFPFNWHSGEFENERFCTQQRRFQRPAEWRLNIFVPINEMKNVRLHLDTISFWSPITENLAHFMMSQVTCRTFNTVTLECSLSTFSKLLERLRVDCFTMGLNHRYFDSLIDVGNMDYVSFYHGNNMSLEAVQFLNPKISLDIDDVTVTEKMLRNKIESMTRNLMEDTTFRHYDGLTLDSFTSVLEGLGNRARVVYGTVNCWSVAPETSKNPCLWVVYRTDAIKLIRREKFYLCFCDLAVFDISLV